MTAGSNRHCPGGQGCKSSELRMLSIQLSFYYARAPTFFSASHAARCAEDSIRPSPTPALDPCSDQHHTHDDPGDQREPQIHQLAYGV